MHAHPAAASAAGAPALPKDLPGLRARFDYLRECCYLDTAAAGLSWQGHGAAVARFFDEHKRRGIDARARWQAVAQRVRERVAAWLGVRTADLSFVANTTEALNLAALSLHLMPGDRIVLADDEFPSVRRIWGSAVRAGAQLVRVPIPHEAQRQQRLLEALRPGTRLLVASQVHSVSGTALDLEALAQRCRECGTLLVIDGIQALGAVPVRLGDSGAPVDVYATSFFKWMLSSFGLGLLVTSPAAREQMTPAYQGYANEPGPEAAESPLQYAHQNLPALYGLDATLDLIESVGWPAVFAQVAALGARLVEQARRHGLDLLTPPEQGAGIWSFRCSDARQAEAWRLQLSAQGISVSARGAALRVSPYAYNTGEEVDRCVAAIAAVHALA